MPPPPLLTDDDEHRGESSSPPWYHIRPAVRATVRLAVWSLCGLFALGSCVMQPGRMALQMGAPQQAAVAADAAFYVIAAYVFCRAVDSALFHDTK